MHSLVLLAKKAVEIFIQEGKIISVPEDFPEEFSEKKMGAFVTIEKKGNLRGCIGTYLPTQENIAKEIIQNAIAAATEDYRFGPIQKEELSYLSYKVYILKEPELVKNVNELDPKKYGIIVKTVTLSEAGDVISNGHFVPKSGLLLPGLKGIDTIENQILIACQKGGINPIKEKILIYKFTVEKYQ